MVAFIKLAPQKNKNNIKCNFINYNKKVSHTKIIEH